MQLYGICAPAEEVFVLGSIKKTDTLSLPEACRNTEHHAQAKGKGVAT